MFSFCIYCNYHSSFSILIVIKTCHSECSFSAMKNLYITHSLSCWTRFSISCRIINDKLLLYQRVFYENLIMMSCKIRFSLTSILLLTILNKSFSLRNNSSRVDNHKVFAAALLNSVNHHRLIIPCSKN